MASKDFEAKQERWAAGTAARETAATTARELRKNISTAAAILDRRLHFIFNHAVCLQQQRRGSGGGGQMRVMGPRRRMLMSDQSVKAVSKRKKLGEREGA
jgi:hypothetical protein